MPTREELVEEGRRKARHPRTFARPPCKVVAPQCLLIRWSRFGSREQGRRRLENRRPGRCDRLALLPSVDGSKRCGAHLTSSSSSACVSSEPTLKIFFALRSTQGHGDAGPTGRANWSLRWQVASNASPTNMEATAPDDSFTESLSPDCILASPPSLACAHAAYSIRNDCARQHAACNTRSRVPYSPHVT
jgi:hypothetical protein